MWEKGEVFQMGEWRKKEERSGGRGNFHVFFAYY